VELDDRPVIAATALFGFGVDRVFGQYGHVSHDANRLASTRVRRAAVARNARSAGTAAPVLCENSAEVG
jgi:hypothetical protein